MSRVQSILSKASLLAIPFAVAALAPASAVAQQPPPPAPPPPADVPPPPPDAYIATVQPEYFEGRPVYWYNGFWYYRDRGAWSYYRHEPDYLRDRHAHWTEHARWHYHR